MIQRVQSLYLGLALIATILMFFLKFVSLELGDISVDLFYSELKGLDAAPEGKMILTVILPLLAISLLATLSRFKNRKLQLKLCKLNYILITGLLLGIFLYMQSTMKTHFPAEPTIEVGIATYLSAVVLLMNIMAARGISKDEKLIRSVDRLR